MNIKRVHYFSGLTLALFIAAHLFNHLFALRSVTAHIEVNKMFRMVYQNPVVEVLLLGAVIIQVVSGIRLYRHKRKIAGGIFEKMHIWSGLYLAFFLVFHVSAVLAGRFILKLDTNFYFGAAGLNSFPTLLFFVPYYTLAITAVFAHIAVVHNLKMKRDLFGVQPKIQSLAIVVIGIAVAFVVLLGMTNHFQGIDIPQAYRVLIGE
jgi:succinate dehydrogenase/fumarate reductase cytochrome b subunit